MARSSADEPLLVGARWPAYGRCREPRAQRRLLTRAFVFAWASHFFHPTATTAYVHPSVRGARSFRRFSRSLLGAIIQAGGYPSAFGAAAALAITGLAAFVAWDRGRAVATPAGPDP